MKNKEIVESVLEIIGKDEELTAAFASALGVSEKEFGDVIDFVVIPELVCKGGLPVPQ
jgi:hypothetical protein